MKRIWFFRLVIVVVLLGVGSQVQAQDDRNCADCHEKELAAWQTSPHATGYHAEGFQFSLASASNPNLCLQCHTTGFSARTQTFKHEGVACEACHGQTPAEHPDVPELPAPSAEVCGDCHVTSYQDWKNSLHGEHDLDCQTCHAPHEQTLVNADSQALCLECHAENLPESFAHTAHPEQACADCHWYRADQDFTVHVLDGSLMPSGHDGLVTPRACSDCHAEYDEDYQLLLAEFTSDPLAAQVEILQLEAEKRDVSAQSQNAEAVNLIQGLLLGAVVGGLITLFWAQIRGR